MAKASWKGVTLAESDTHESVEGNVYFPPDTINKEYFRDSDTHTSCPWKGVASYYDIVVWDISKTTYTEFLFLGIPVLLIWLWCIYSIFKREETIEYLSSKK